MQCAFEEKQFEQLLSSELVVRRPILYPAGQVLKYVIGIDSAVQSRNNDFWNLWKNRRWSFFQWWRLGLYMEPWVWDRLEDRINMFPKFKVNIFLQYKRPEFMVTSSSKEWDYWNSAYYRFDIDSYQQNILYNLEQRTLDDAIVVYACPAFSERQKLLQYGEQRQIIKNSNFVEPHNLHNKQRYTFVSAGKTGIACSQPLQIEGIDILKELDEKMFESSENLSNTDFVYSLSKSLSEIGKEFKDYQAFKILIDKADHNLAKAFTNIFAFLIFSDLSWGIGYQGNNS